VNASAGKLSPGRGKLSLGRAKLSLGRGKLSLGRAKLSLGRGKLSLGRGKLSLGRGKLSLGRGKLSLGRGSLSGAPPSGPPCALSVCHEAHLGGTGPLSQGVQAGRQALRMLHMHGVGVRKKRPRGVK
jgi:hypothetical protein